MKRIIIVVLMLSGFTFSQDENFYRITLRDGQSYEGRILYEDDQSITIEISDGVQIQIDRNKIRGN